jgi:hypothetical protein
MRRTRSARIRQPLDAEVFDHQPPRRERVVCTLRTIGQMVDTKVVFYRWQSANAQAPFVPHEVASRLERAIVADPSQALVVGQDTTTAVRVLDAGGPDAPTRLQVLAVRGEDNQPVEWSPGQTVRSLIVSEGHFTADVTHVCIWPNGFAAQDWHGYAPRLNRLAHYLRQQANAHAIFNTLYRPDMMTTLHRIRGHLRTVEIALTSPEYANIDRSGAIGTLFPAVYGHRAPSLSVRFGMGRYGPRDRYIDHETEEAVFAVAENAQDLVDRMIISGYDPQVGRVVNVNLLSERVGKEVTVEPNPEAATLPDEQLIFDEIFQARSELADEGLLDGAPQAQAMRAT